MKTSNMKTSNKILIAALMGISAITLAFYAPHSQAACGVNCNTGKENYPISWKDSYKANFSNQSIPYTYGTSEYGENLSGADLTNTTRSFYGTTRTATLDLRHKNYFNTRMPDSSILSAPGVNKEELTIYPIKDAAGNTIMADNTGSNFQHANMRCVVIGNAIMRNVNIYDVDMTNAVHLGTVDYSGALLQLVNLTGVAFVTHTDGSLILKNVPADKQPTIVDGFKTITTTSTNANGTTTTTTKYKLIKYTNKVGWYWSPSSTSTSLTQI